MSKVQIGMSYILKSVKKQVLKWKSWKYITHAFFGVAAFLCFLPQMIGYSLLFSTTTDDTLINIKENNQLYTAYIVSIAITGSSLFEKWIDYFLSNKFFPQLPSDKESGITYFEFPNEILLIIIAKDVLILFYVLPYEQYNLLNGILLGADTLFIWCYFFNLSRLGDPIWSLLKVSVISGIFAILNIIYSWMSMSETAANDENLVYFCQTIVAVAFFFLFVVMGQWIYYIWKTINETTDTLVFLKVIQASIFILFLLIYLLADWGSTYDPTDSADWGTFGTTYIITMTYMMSGCTALVGIMSGRVSKFGSMIFSNKLLAVRKMFMRYVSHEMRTPLNTAVLGMNVLLKQFEKSLEMPIDHVCYLTAKDIQSSCRIAVEILNDMLLYDKIESGLLALELTAISPWSFLKSTVKPFFIQAQELGVTIIFKLKIPDFECLVNMDKHKIGQVVRNLISNSLKFCQKPGTVHIKVDVISSSDLHRNLMSQESEKLTPIPMHSEQKKYRYFRKSSVISPIYIENEDCEYYLRFTVKDDGAGLAEENQAKLFHGIIQFNPGKLQNGQGTGLGLYISKGIMDSHQGDLFVKSDGEGCGSTFTFLLPIEKNISTRTLENSELIVINKSNEINDIEIFELNQTYIYSSNDTNLSIKNTATPTQNESEHDIKEADLGDHVVPFHDTTLETPIPTPIFEMTNKLKLRKINVLIVDDSGLCRTMVKRAIASMNKDGCRLNVDQASDGKKAVAMIKIVMKIDTQDDYDSTTDRIQLKALNRTKSVIKVTAETIYDLILMDYQMPHMDGPTAIRQIRELGYKGQIVGLTGNVVSTEVEVMRESGANNVLFKPVEFSDIEKLILEL